MTTAISADEHALSPEDLEHFETQGFVTLSRAVSNEQVSAANDAVWQFLGMDRNDPEDWYRPPHSPNSLVEIYQHQALWDNRQSPRIYRAFCQLWGTDKLWVSLDRASMKPPVDSTRPDWQWPSFMHWDFDLTGEMPVQFGVQGVLCLSDTTEDQGGFHCIPGMHREVIEWSKTPAEQRDPKVLPFERDRVRAIAAKAGDMILWHRALPHGSGINRTDRPRLAQYILAAPAGYNVSIYQPQDGSPTSAAPARETMRQHRIAQWERRIGPAGPAVDPREAGPPAVLTPLGRRLLGLDAWE
ncbi:DUF1479 family protein [soil metagenome]